MEVYEFSDIEDYESDGGFVVDDDDVFEGVHYSDDDLSVNSSMHAGIYSDSEFDEFGRSLVHDVMFSDDDFGNDLSDSGLEYPFVDDMAEDSSNDVFYASDADSDVIIDSKRRTTAIFSDSDE